MKNILLIFLYLASISLVSAQSDNRDDRKDKSDRRSERVDFYTVDHEDLESLLEGLESLENLEGLEGLAALEKLEGLEGLEGLDGLDALDCLQDVGNLGSLNVFSNYNHHGNYGNSRNHRDNNMAKKEHKISMTSGTISIEGLDEVEVIAYQGNEVILSRSSHNHDDDDRSRGLKVINSLGLDDNTGLGLSAEKDGSTLTISQISKTCCGDDLEIKVPFGITIEVSNSSVGSGTIKMTDIKDEIVISTSYGSVELDNVSGPLAIKSVYGSIEGDISNLSQTGSISLNSVYSLIDISIPVSSKVDIELSTPYGEIYTNIDIDVEKSSNMRRLSSKRIRGTINGGGVDMSIKSGYSHIYLRKK